MIIKKSIVVVAAALAFGLAVSELSAAQQAGFAVSSNSNSSASFKRHIVEALRSQTSANDLHAVAQPSGMPTTLASPPAVACQKGTPCTAPNLLQVTIAPKSLNIPVGLYRQFNATGLLSDRSTKDLTGVAHWRSSNNSVAIIDATGKAWIRSKGTTVITASLNVVICQPVPPTRRGGILPPRSRCFTRTISGSTSLAGVISTPTNLLVDNFGSSATSGVANFSVHPSSGALTLLTTFDNNSSPSQPVLTRDQRWLFVLSYDNSISGFSVDQSTQGLIQLPWTQPTGTIPIDAVISQDDRSLYTANAISNDISGFSIDPSTGALTPIPGSPFPTGTAPFALVMHSQFLYVANALDNTISVYSRDVVGALTHLADQSLPGKTPVAMALDVTGSFLYVVDSSTSDVSVFHVNATTGALTIVAGSPFLTGKFPFSIALDPSGSYAYVSNIDDNTISAFKIESRTGGLISMGTFQADFSPENLLIDPSGQFLYVGIQGDFTAASPAVEVRTFSINPVSGVLVPLLHTPVGDSVGPMVMISKP